LNSRKTDGQPNAEITHGCFSAMGAGKVFRSFMLANIFIFRNTDPGPSPIHSATCRTPSLLFGPICSYRGFPNSGVKHSIRGNSVRTIVPKADRHIRSGCGGFLLKNYITNIYAHFYFLKINEIKYAKNNQLAKNDEN